MGSHAAAVGKGVLLPLNGPPTRHSTESFMGLDDIDPTEHQFSRAAGPRLEGILRSASAATLTI